ncbi:hypothetical protein BN2537_503 [Streptomyces venezuelae]|nr:hypothetical protein BN2537_503 [Streptomyces venezuelae]
MFSVGQRPCHPPRRKWAPAAFVLPAAGCPRALGGLSILLSKHGAIREHREGGVRILYVSTALGTLVLVAYVETD